MGVFLDLLNEVETKNKDLSTQVKILCDQIRTEEESRLINTLQKESKINQEKDEEIQTPRGPNIFLALPVPGVTVRDISFLCLERELKESFIISVWSKAKYIEGPLRRISVYPIPDGEPAKRILTEYARKYKVMKGEL